MKEYIISMLKNYQGERKIIIDTNMYLDIIVVDKTGIYLIKVSNYSGTINKINEKHLLNGLVKVDNPMYYLKEDINKIDNKNVKYIIVTRNDLYVDVVGNFVSLNEFYY